MIHHSLHRLKQSIYHFSVRKKEWVFLNYNTFCVGFTCGWSLESLAFFTRRVSVTFLSYFLLRIENPQPVPDLLWTRNAWFLTRLINFPIVISYSRAKLITLPQSNLHEITVVPFRATQIRFIPNMVVTFIVLFLAKTSVSVTSSHN